MIKKQYHYFTALLTRELFSVATAPSLWTIFIAYLFASAILSLTLGGFIDANRADLSFFFSCQPWLFLLCCPALASASWHAELQKGCQELLHAWPISPALAVLAKFCSTFLVMFFACILTFPLPIYCLYLGNPDIGAILSGYFGTTLNLLLFTAVSHFSVLLNKRQFGGHLTALLIGLLLLLPGFRPGNILLLKWGVSSAFLDTIASFSLLRHLEAFFDGLILLADCLYFLLMTSAFLSASFAKASTQKHSRSFLKLHYPLFCLCILKALLLPLIFPQQLDLTEHRIFTLDEATKKILATLPPTHLTLVYSASLPELDTSVRLRASRIRHLFRQLRRYSSGKLLINETDPVTDEQQNQAEAQGLTPHVSASGELWFLGAKIACGEHIRVVPDLLQPEENTLEYILANDLQHVQHSRRPVLGIVSTLPVFEHYNIQKKTLEPAWYFLRQLALDYDIMPIDSQKSQLSSAPDVLLLIHPVSLPESLTKSIRDYMNGGGHAIVFLDPLSKVAESNQKIYRLARPSNIPALLKDYGIELMGNRVIADKTLATPMTDPERGLETIPTLLTLTNRYCNASDNLTRYIERLNFFCAGALRVTDDSKASVIPLCSSSKQAHILPVYAARRNSADILKDYSEDNTEYSIALLAKSKCNGSEIAVIADADFLHNSLSVNAIQNNDGTLFEQPVNDNVSWIKNLLDKMTGRICLSHLRSRGKVVRSFTRIEQLAHKTEEEVMQADRDAMPSRKLLSMQLKELTEQAEQNQETISESVKEQIAVIQQKQADLERQVKIKQRILLHRLRLSINAIERRIALSCALLIPLLLGILAGIIALKRRSTFTIS